MTESRNRVSSSPGPSTGYLLTKAAQATTARFAAVLAPLNLRPKHYGLLAAVALLPSASQQQLARALGLVPSAIVTMVDDLEDRGALVRRQEPGDRRQLAIEITETGRQLLAEAGRLGEQVDDEILGTLTPTERTVLHQALTKAAGKLGVPGTADPGR